MKPWILRLAAGALLLACAADAANRAVHGGAEVKGFPFLRVGKTYCIVLQGASDCGGDAITISEDAGGGWVRGSGGVWINLNLVSGLKEVSSPQPL